MGLFSSKYITYVDSVAYNMSGDYKDRTNYLKTITIGAVMKGKVGIGKSITDSLIKGTYLTQVNLLRWARNNYADGVPWATLGGSTSLDPDVSLAYLNSLYPNSPQTVLHESIAAKAAAMYWARQYIYATYPTEPGATPPVWTYDVFTTAQPNPRVRVSVEGYPPAIVPMTGYIEGATYAYITHTLSEAVTRPDGSIYYVDTLPMMTIYRFGSGNAGMDAIWPRESLDQSAQFMPFMPVRIENRFITEDPYRNTYYEKCRKFYKKASGGKKIETLIDQLKDNDSLGDIDFAFMVYGMSLNTKTKENKRYLYELFRTMMEKQQINSADFEIWYASLDAKNREADAIYDRYREYGPDSTLEEMYRKYSGSPKSGIKYNTMSQRSNWLPNLYQIYHHWIHISQTLLTGSQNPGRQINDIWTENLTSITATTTTVSRRRTGGQGDYTIDVKTETDVIPRFYIYRQVSATVAIRIIVVGLMQENMVYNGKNILINSRTALNDPEESSLVLPMHMASYKKCPPKVKNQVAAENTYMIFNCYTVVKQRWYQRGIFKFVFALVIAVISVLLPPLGASVGILGSALSVGAAMGFTGMTAAIVGAITNAVVAMLLSTLINKVASDLFDGLIGSIIGSLLGMFLMSGFTSVFNGGGITIEWGNLMKVDNLLKLTDSISQGYSAYVQSSVQGLQQQTQNYVDWATEEMRNIEKLYTDVLKVGNTLINPLMFTESASTSVESENSYLARTLMSGSDIAGLSIDMLTNFAELTLTLPDAYG